jgi:hypothetical protein
MTQPLQLNIKSSWLDRVRQLTINSDYIEFDDKDGIADPPTKFLTEEIESFRFGVKWINGYQFVIGRIYCVDIRSKNSDIIKIRLKSIYGINKKKLGEKYASILNALYDNYFDKLSMSYLNLFNNHRSFEILNVRFDQNGITLIDKKAAISWDDVGTRSYSTYYSIFAKANPDVYQIFEFLSEWNTGILYSVSRQILKDKGLYSE